MISARAMFWAALALALIPAVRVQGAGYSLGAAVDAVLRRSPGVAGAGYRVQEAEASLREVRMKRLPSLALESSFTRSDNPVYAFGTLLDQKAFTAADFSLNSLNNPSLQSNFRNYFEVGVPLFTGFELQSHERLGRLGRDAAASGFELAGQAARYAAAEAFLQVILQRELGRTLAERIAASESEIESARRLKGKGLVLGSDFFAAQATLGGLRAWQSKAAAGLAGAKSRLAALLGEPAQSLDAQGSLDYQVCPADAEADWLDQALSRRPELRRSSLQEDMAGVWRRREGYSLLPTVEAFGAMETDTKDFNGNPWNKMFGVKARLPLGDPGYPARRDRAQAALEASRAETQGAREGVRIEVGQVYQGYRGACESLPIAKDMVEKAEESLRLFRPLYREGRQSIMEVLRAEEGMARAQAAFLEGLYGVRAGKARLLLAAGSLDGQAVKDLEKGLGAAR